MGVNIAYTDASWTAQGELRKYSVDLDIGDSNDFEIDMNLKNHVMAQGSIWYVDGGEIGGIVDTVTVNTNSNSVAYSGRSWRGILDGKIIEPDSGEDYYILSGDANEIIQTLIDRFGLGDLFSAPSYDSGFALNSFQFDRYVTGLSGINKMLSSVGAKLQISRQDTTVLIEAVAVEDLADTYEFLDDFGIAMELKQTNGGVNHLICLGAGDLADRLVIHLYVDSDGNISDTQYYTGTQEIASIYDYSTIEDEDELRESGIETLETLKSTDSASATMTRTDVDLNIGDIISGKNRQTGIYIKQTISSKIIKIQNGILTQTYTIGG